MFYSVTPMVLSPCVSLCQMDEASGFCKGCFRTIDEIVSWSQLPDDGKRQVWQRIGERQNQTIAKVR